MSLTPVTAHTSMPSFPNEIVAIILEFSLLEDFSVFQIAGGLPTQYVFMAVSKDWKGVCLSYPELWTRICIDLLPASPTAGTDVSIWNRFAIVCQDALARSESLPLDLWFDHWHFGDQRFQDVSAEQGFDEWVIHSSMSSFKIMRFSIEQSFRWKSFALKLYDRILETGTMAEIPWSDLVNVAKRVPQLESLYLDVFHNFWTHRSDNAWMDTFLRAPKLDVVYFNAGSTPLNLPWAQLTEINIETHGFNGHGRLADYFDVVMRRTTAPTVSWGSNLDFAIDDGNIVPVPPVIENPHIVKLKLSPMILQPVLLPNLTNLEFYISDEKDIHIDSVSQIVQLLKGSDCRLLDLTINQWSANYNGDITSFDPLLPHLDSLQSLTWNASLVNEEIAIDLLAGLRSILVANDPVKLPNLIALAINLLQAPCEQDDINFCYFDSHQAQDIWNIAQARMLVWPVVKLEKFHIDVRSDNNLQMFAGRQDFDGCEEGNSIKASSVDFKLCLPFETPA